MAGKRSAVGTGATQEPTADSRQTLRGDEGRLPAVGEESYWWVVTGKGRRGCNSRVIKGILVFMLIIKVGVKFQILLVKLLKRAVLAAKK